MCISWYRRRFHFLKTCQFCIVCAISAACMIDSRTMVAFLLLASTPWVGLDNARCHFSFRSIFRSGSNRSVAMTRLTSSWRNRFFSLSSVNKQRRSSEYVLSIRSPQPKSIEFCSETDLLEYSVAISSFSRTSCPLGTPGWSTSWIKAANKAAKWANGSDAMQRRKSSQATAPSKSDSFLSILFRDIVTWQACSKQWKGFDWYEHATLVTKSRNCSSTLSLSSMRSGFTRESSFSARSLLAAMSR
mmetsp:Transcript_26865/g.75438  ORF Transcript_26865/g.75438 Transcript_26865/m.75438 type:complete len:245 (+) Transcript_26865:404-1138(+)